MSAVQNINPEKEPIPRSWVPRVVTGGKDNDPPDTPVECWLDTLPIGSVFVAAQKGSMFGHLYELIYRGEVFSLLQQDAGNDIINDIRVIPKMWCSIHKDYEVLNPKLPSRGEEDEPVYEQRDPL